MQTLYKQCKLQKGNVIHTAWIPNKFAKKGKYLELKKNKKWQNGWLVLEVFNNILDHNCLMSKRDVCLPSIEN